MCTVDGNVYHDVEQVSTSRSSSMRDSVYVHKGVYNNVFNNNVGNDNVYKYIESVLKTRPVYQNEVESKRVSKRRPVYENEVEIKRRLKADLSTSTSSKAKAL